VLVSSPGGWLVEECRRLGVPTIEEPFPRSRSLPGRLFGNGNFARRVVRKLEPLSMQPVIVQANDHQEGLLGLELGKQLEARTAIYLRSVAMTRDDYFKYRCDGYDFIAAVGDVLRARAQAWDPRREVALIQDGISADEFGPPKPKRGTPPRRVLAIGSPLELKGWADLTEALFLLEQAGTLPGMQFDFTGAAPAPAENNLRLERLAKARCNFLGRVDAFRDLVLSYDLVINPSRMETFGMAAIEALAAGVPVLSSRTGIIEQVLDANEMLFPPQQPASLASALERLLTDWTNTDFGVASAQERIRQKFLVDHTASLLNSAYERLVVAQS
jgi:glycosyltransferase involved in cell wall biosynthesis